MGRRAYRVAYDGTGYRGFQRQPDVPTVEDALLDALRALDAFEGTVPAGWAGAGRTDAGVSALAQTVAFEAPEWLSPAAFTSELPADVWAWAAADAPAGFHATHDAAARTYTYYLHAPREAVADDRAREAARALSGRQDVHNLTPDDEGTVREVEATVAREGAFLVLRFRAGGFPRQFVRRAVALVDTHAREGAGDLLARALSAETLSGPDGIGPAPADPLVLTDVAYDLAFAADPSVRARARQAFADRRARHAARARVAGRVAGGLDPDDGGDDG